jgi:hypothetical protein
MGVPDVAQRRMSPRHTTNTPLLLHRPTCLHVGSDRRGIVGGGTHAQARPRSPGRIVGTTLAFDVQTACHRSGRADARSCRREGAPGLHTGAQEPAELLGWPGGVAWRGCMEGGVSTRAWSALQGPCGSTTTRNPMRPARPASCLQGKPPAGLPARAGCMGVPDVAGWGCRMSPNAGCRRGTQPTPRCCFTAQRACTWEVTDVE